MPATRRQKYTPEYRANAVELVRESGKPVAEIARDLGMNEGTLANWVGKAREENGEPEQPLTTSERAELDQLRKDNQTLRMERDFLRRAAAYFANPQQ